MILDCGHKNPVINLNIPDQGHNIPMTDHKRRILQPLVRGLVAA
jgi:hypothetical protein